MVGARLGAFEVHRNGTVYDNRRRRRYDCLKFGIWNSCLNFVIYTSAPPDEIAGAEAVAITLAQTHATGPELKVFNRHRHPRGRKPDHRSRPVVAVGDGEKGINQAFIGTMGLLRLGTGQAARLTSQR